LDKIWFDIALDSEVNATRFVSEIVAKFPLLATHPHMAIARPDIAPDARAFPYRRYLILYRVEQQGVAIVRVVQGAQRLKGLFDN